MEAEPPKRKRRWYQFSLRTLLIVVATVAIPCALLGRRVAQKRQEQAAVDTIRKHGGIVVYDYQTTKLGLMAPEPFGPAWVRRLFGENFFSEVETVSLVNDNATDADLLSLKCLVNLKQLILDGDRITDAGMTNITNLTRLDTFLLGRAHITNASLVSVAKLQSLQRLMLMGTWMDDAGLETLKAMTQLKNLTLQCPKVTDHGIEELQRALPNCEIQRYGGLL